MIQSSFVIILIVYLTVIYTITYFVSKQNMISQGNQFLNSYFIGNRRIGVFLLALTIASTYASSSSFIGGPGAAYNYGLGWIVIAMIQIPAIFFVLMVIGRRLAFLSNKFNLITVIDVLKHTYNDSKIVIPCAIALILGFFGMMITQIIGGARLIEGFFSVQYHTALIGFVFVIAIYTMIGGFTAVIYTDLVQGIIMIIGSIILLIATIHKIGGLDEVVPALQAIDPKLLEWSSGGDISVSLILSFWVLVCFGLIGLPHTTVRAMSYNNTHTLYRGIIVATIVMVIIMFCFHFSALLGRILGIEAASPDLIIPTLMKTVLNDSLATAVIIAPMAAIMSSVDSQLIQSSATIIKDLILGQNNKISEVVIKRLVRVINLIILLLLVLFSLSPPQMVIWLNLVAFGALQSTFFWPIVLGIFWKNANSSGATAAIIVGPVSYSLLTLSKVNILGTHPIIPSLTLGLLSFIIFNNFGDSKNVVRN